MSNELDWNDDESVVRAAFGEVYGMNSTHHFPDWKEARKYPTVMEWEKAHRPAPIEGVVLPDYMMRYAMGRDAEGFSTGTLVPCDYGQWIPSVSVHRLHKDLLAQLAEAIAQRDAQRSHYIQEIESMGRLRNEWMERAEKAEAALTTACAEVNGWRERALNAEFLINNGRGDTAAERSIDL
jgi:hypothetical protein